MLKCFLDKIDLDTNDIIKYMLDHQIIISYEENIQKNT